MGYRVSGVGKPPLNLSLTAVPKDQAFSINYTLQSRIHGIRLFGRVSPDTRYPIPDTLQFLVAIAAGSHPFPFRTRPLSPPAPKILGAKASGKIGRRQNKLDRPSVQSSGGPVCIWARNPAVWYDSKEETRLLRRLSTLNADYRSERSSL